MTANADKSRMQEFIRPRINPFIACLISVGLCLMYAKFRSGLPPWWRSVGGGIPYVVFWILLWYSMLPERRFILRISIGCTLFTCLLEVMQLWRAEWLVKFRRTKFGAALLGSTFAWEDIPPYLIGGLVGFVVLHAIVRMKSQWQSQIEP